MSNEIQALPPGTAIPSGPQFVTVVNSGNASLQIPGVNGTPFRLFFIYEYSAGPATYVILNFNGQNFQINPGLYQLPPIMANSLGISYQVDAGQSIKLGWIFD